MQKTGIITKMSIRTSKNSKGQILSNLSPVRSLLESMLAATMAWVARKKDKKTGNRIGKVTKTDSIIKYEKDTFSLYGICSDCRTISINDIRGEAVFLRILPSGRLDTANIFVFCLGSGKYILTDWLSVWQVSNKLIHDKGTVIYKDAWRMDRNKFVTLLQKIVSGKI